MICAYTSDGRIVEKDLVLLDDPLRVFPPYDAILLLSRKGAQNAKLREALMPLAWRLAASGAVERIFAPCAVPERFRKFYSLPDALRPSQLRTVREEAAMLPEMTMRLSALYKGLDVPVRLLAGSDDGIVDTDAHSVRLQRELAKSTLKVIPRCGHMVHHAAPNEVAHAIVGLSHVEQTRPTCLGVPRHWLQIDGSATVH